MKKLVLTISVIVAIALNSANAQMYINEANEFFTIDFDNTVSGVNNGPFAGNGFVSNPSEGELDASAWAIEGTSEGDKDFDTEANTGIFAKGIIDLMDYDSGIYAAEVATDNFALSLVPSDDDFTPGNVALKLQNSTGTDIVGITISFDVYYINSGDRSTKITGAYSPNNSFWIPYSELEFITPTTADPTPELQQENLSITGNVPITDGDYFYFRIEFSDHSGSGDRDLVAIDNISFKLYDDLPCVPIDITNNIQYPDNIYTETFEEESQYLHCWTQEYVAGTNDWTYQSGSNMGAINSAHIGDRNARFTSTPGGPQISKLISPQFDLTGVNDPVLRFWYAQEEITGNQNELKVYYRTTPENPWVEIAHYTDNINIWTVEPFINLPNPSATYQIAFEGIDNNGAANVVDNVSILSHDDLPVITEMDINNDVQNVVVCIGTEDVEIPLGMLATQMTIKDSYDITHIVDLDWSIENYDGNTVDTYIATGEFELPLSVEQTDPPTLLEITTNVIVSDLPEVTCPEDILLETEQTYTITGANPAGGSYYLDGNLVSQINTGDMDNGDYLITYEYTSPTTSCTNHCEFIITIQLPSEIEDIDIYDDVQDIFVCVGTSQSQAISELTPNLTILDSNGGEHVVTINWTVESYNGNSPGSYQAIGTFQLPEGVFQTDPVTPLIVHTDVIVAPNPVVTCPEDMTVLITDEPFDLEGATPEGGEYLVNGSPFFLFNPQFQGIGDHYIQYIYSDPESGCTGSCAYYITVEMETSANKHKKMSFNIYPNPNSGDFNIIFDNMEYNAKIEIIDNNARVIHSNKIKENTNKLEISLNLNSGIYYIRIISEKNISIEKLIIN